MWSNVNDGVSTRLFINFILFGQIYLYFLSSLCLCLCLSPLAFSSPSLPLSLSLQFSLCTKRLCDTLENWFVNLIIQITMYIITQVCSSNKITQLILIFFLLAPMIRTFRGRLPSSLHVYLFISSLRGIFFQIFLCQSPLGYACYSQQSAGQLYHIPKWVVLWFLNSSLSYVFSRSSQYLVASKPLHSFRNLVSVWIGETES